MAQEAFLTAYQKIDQLRDPAAFPGWLKRIVLTYCNRITRQQIALSAAARRRRRAAASRSRCQRGRPRAEEQVNRAVRALPEHEREVTELFYITGYSQQEIAEQLALPLTTVKKRLQYAREHLRETMPPMNRLPFDLLTWAMNSTRARPGRRIRRDRQRYCLQLIWRSFTRSCSCWRKGKSRRRGRPMCLPIGRTPGRPYKHPLLSDSKVSFVLSGDARSCAL